MAAALPADQLHIQPDPHSLREASLWLAERCRQRSVPQELIDRLDLCLNEVLANLVDHAGPGALDTPVELLLDPGDPSGGSPVCLQVRDGGAPFDPTAAPSPTAPTVLAETGIGGLGLVMVRRFCDDMRYRRINDRNELTLCLSWPQETPGR
ncbi:ATP-binding protein [Cyanobium sp. FGCU-52]|nr:ATP-binding protein [Cyanobium sp. FGCU52]